VGAKNVIATMVQSFVAIGVISLLWVIVGYSLAFSANHWGGVIGSLHNFMLHDVNGTPNSYAPTIPSLVYMAFQMQFAVITPALIAGAFSERMRFRGYLVFIGLWSLLVYSPFAHSEWGGLRAAVGCDHHRPRGRAILLRRRAPQGHLPLRRFARRRRRSHGWRRDRGAPHGLRVSAEDEATGLDLSEHGEVGYQQAAWAAPVTITSTVPGLGTPQTAKRT
jgi:ammonia channel protein AmtB